MMQEEMTTLSNNGTCTLGPLLLGRKPMAANECILLTLNQMGLWTD